MPWDKDALSQRRMGAELQGIGLDLGRLWRPGLSDIERLVVRRCQPADGAALGERAFGGVSVRGAVAAPEAHELGATSVIGGDVESGRGASDAIEVSVRLHGRLLSGSMKRPTPATLTAAGVFEDYWMREMGYRGLGSASGGGASTLREWP